MNRSLGYIMFMAGMFMLLVSFVFPMVTVVVDNTPPAWRILHPSTATGTALTELVAYVKDPESDIQSVTCKVAGTTHSLSYVLTDSFFKDEKWYKDIPDIMPSGSYSFEWTITNKAGLTTTVSGIYTIYTGLQGKWYVNNVEITSTSQTVYATSTTVSFKFAKTAGIADSSITCTVTEGASTLVTLTNSAVATWTGNYTFSAGTHTLELKASDGTQTVTMSVIGMQIGPTTPKLPQLNTLQILGLASTGIGLLLIFTGRRKSGGG